jgi:hypothetical protein
MNANKNVLTILIHRPVADVFAYTINPSNTSKWVEGVSEETIDTNIVDMGTKFKNDLGELKVTDIAKDKVFELSDTAGSYVVRYEYEPTDIGTSLTYSEWMEDGSDLCTPMKLNSLEKLKECLEL